jgi:hypothetical protein
MLLPVHLLILYPVQVTTYLPFWPLPCRHSVHKVPPSPGNKSRESCLCSSPVLRDVMSNRPAQDSGLGVGKLLPRARVHLIIELFDPSSPCKWYHPGHSFSFVSGVRIFFRSFSPQRLHWEMHCRDTWQEYPIEPHHVTSNRCRTVFKCSLPMQDPYFAYWLPRQTVIAFFRICWAKKSSRHASAPLEIDASMFTCIERKECCFLVQKARHVAATRCSQPAKVSRVHPKTEPTKGQSA